MTSSHNTVGSSWDTILVGGGHNGLTAAAYLARAGLSTLVLERRPIVGGACVTEEVWPGARVSRCSYVVSMLQPKVVADLELKRFGYEAHPLDPAYAAMTPDGPIIFHDDLAKTQESIAKFNKKDAEAYGRFEELLFMAADFVRPMMIRTPPAPGSRAPADIAGILKEAGRIAGMSKPQCSANFWSSAAITAIFRSSGSSSQDTQLRLKSMGLPSIQDSILRSTMIIEPGVGTQRNRITSNTDAAANQSSSLNRRRRMVRNMLGWPGEICAPL